MAKNFSVDDAVMKDFDSLVGSMRAKRLAAELPQAEAQAPDAGPDESADDSVLEEMLGDYGSTTE